MKTWVSIQHHLLLKCNVPKPVWDQLRCRKLLLTLISAAQRRAEAAEEEGGGGEAEHHGVSVQSARQPGPRPYVAAHSCGAAVYQLVMTTPGYLSHHVSFWSCIPSHIKVYTI